MNWPSNTWDESKGWIYENYVAELLPEKYSFCLFQVFNNMHSFPGSMAVAYSHLLIKLTSDSAVTFNPIYMYIYIYIYIHIYRVIYRHD